ncbi:hypothetical protein EYR40_005894 [Pleurotus pulmonarius]|nr:hypothetical protein EYR40_005894 [Pleurotus pulmonarius]
MSADFVQNFDRLHFRPLALSTMALQDRAHLLWLAFQSKLLGSMEAAEATLESGASLPNINRIKQFVFFAVKTGTSRLHISGVTGWSYTTNKVFVGALWGMLHQHGVQVPTAKDRDQLNQALQEVYASTIAKNFKWLQLMAILAFTYQQGTCIGSLVEARHYEGTGQCLKWGDIEFVAFQWEETIGLAIQSFITLHWNKALGITQDIFETDVLAMHKECPVSQMPILIKIKDSAKDTPVWQSGNEQKPWTAAGPSNLLKKLTNELGWQSICQRAIWANIRSQPQVLDGPWS